MSNKTTRYVTRSTTVAAGAIATAVTAAAVAASVILSPVPNASSRMDGVHQDLMRAVQLNQLTLEQAQSFEQKMAGQIYGEA
ncbi:hypothetical protein [Pseudarthrobacter sp. PS3-L1]|uniref:hypothetical protein n=1 Tax=Pseudarthrobacter sp. PS3-L1 TaxID=3046207 RepID=UPI0024B9BAAF|nr:hypothetical protein [Pseudarthrobacter sp. PS3-L1]MDJ0321207.1 hypothetical protein [Pseudarthrobacter sp. PS3-L1]